MFGLPQRSNARQTPAKWSCGGAEACGGGLGQEFISPLIARFDRLISLLMENIYVATTFGVAGKNPGSPEKKSM